MQENDRTVENLDDTGAQFADDDVFFECPRCDKSMAIAKEGIGMVVNCPQCSLAVVVPAPGGEAEYADAEDSQEEFDVESIEQSDEVAVLDTQPKNSGYVLSKEKRDLLFDEMAGIQRSLDRIVALLDQ